MSEHQLVIMSGEIKTLRVVCGKCGTVVQVPIEKLAATFKDGICHFCGGEFRAPMIPSEDLIGNFARALQALNRLDGLASVEIVLPPALLKPVRDAGLVPGVLDIWIPVPRPREPVMGGTTAIPAPNCGLVLELKKLKGGRPSKEQLEWAAHLKSSGWRVYFPQGALDAWRCVASYLGITGPDHTARDLEQQEHYIRLLTEPP